MLKEENQIEQELKEGLLKRTGQMLEACVEDALTREVLSCDYEDLVAKGVRMILEHNFLGVLLMKEGRPYNMVTAFDLLRLAYEEVFNPERDFLRAQLGELVAEKEFVYVGPRTKLREALNIMLEKRVRTLPVIEDDKVLGVCSMIDLMNWYRKTHDEIRTGKLALS